MPTPDYDINKEYASRLGYGNALKKLGDIDTQKILVGLDADLKNSTLAEYLYKAHPDMFIECFIQEQNMVSVASGVSCRGRVPFCSTFACFLTRAADQIRMAAMSELNIKFCGSHCGISIGQDGSSQMGLEDISMFRSLPKSTVLYPSDPVSTEKAVQLAYNTNGLFYIRTARMNCKTIYNNNENFQIGKLKLLKEGSSLMIVAAGVTLLQSLQAAKSLEE